MTPDDTYHIASHRHIYWYDMVVVKDKKQENFVFKVMCPDVVVFASVRHLEPQGLLIVHKLRLSEFK